MGFLGDMFAEQPAPQAPPPQVGQSMDAQLALGNRQADLAEKQFAWTQDLSREALDASKQYASAQTDLARRNEARSQEQWDRYKSVFAPVEDRLASDAMGWDSAERQNRVAAEAGTDVATAFDAAKANQDRAAASYGVNSGRFAGLGTGMAVERAKATAGAMTGARRQTELQGVSMRQGVAQTGRNLTSTALNADTLASGATQAAAGTTNAGITTATQAANASLPWYASAGQNLGQAGSTANAYYGNSIRAYGDTLDYNMASKKIVDGQVQNIVGGMMAMASSKDAKTAKKPIAARGVLDEIAKDKEVPVEAWKYKEGVADEGEHIGPYAEDMHEKFGEAVAPGGKKLDMISMNGLLMKGVQEAGQRIQRIEAQLGIA